MEEMGQGMNPSKASEAPEINSERISEDKKIDSSKSDQSSEVSVSIELRISQLRTSISESLTAFKSARFKLIFQIILLSFICSSIVYASFVFAKYLLDPTHIILHDTWTWQTIYYTAIRVTIIGAIFSLAAYSFKLLSSHIQMYQLVEHKIAIIKAMPGFVESGSDPTKRDVILNKLIEMVVNFEDTGILANEPQLKTSNEAVMKLIEIILTSKKE